LTSENAILSLAVLLSTFPVQAQVIHTVAGGGPSNGIVATSASIAGYSPAVDANGNVYFSSGEAVYKLDTTDHLTRVAGQNIAGVFALGANGNACPTAANIGDGGPATSALLNNPRAVAVDGAGNLYIADSFSCRIRVVNMQSSSITVLGVTIAAGNIATVAGSATYGSGGDNGPATSAQLYQPSGVAVDSNGNLYIADTGNSRVRMVNTSGTITAFAGNGTRGCIGDSAAATSAELNSPVGLAADAAGNIYIADDGGCNIRAVNTQSGWLVLYKCKNSFVLAESSRRTQANISVPHLLHRAALSPPATHTHILSLLQSSSPPSWKAPIGITARVRCRLRFTSGTGETQ
jgi:hypothetical protein